MHILALIAFYIGIGLYAAATTLFLLELATREHRTIKTEWAPRLLGAAAACHLTHIVATSLVVSSCPLFSVRSALSVSSLSAVVVFLVWRRREPIGPLGACAAPPALASMIDAHVSAKGPLLGEYSPGVLAVHVASSTIGLAMFLLAGGASAYFLVAERRLKLKRYAKASAKLPPLDVLDRVAHRFLLAGVPAFAVGLVSAMFFRSSGEAATGPEVARSLLAYGSWTIMALVLLMRSMAGWRGKKAAYGTLTGVIFMLMVIALYLSGAGAPGSGRFSMLPKVPRGEETGRAFGTEVGS